MDFAAQGWALADLDIALQTGSGERAVWFGAPPRMADLIAAARTEGVRIVGLEIPFGDEQALAELRTLLERPLGDVLVLPVFPGPRNAFNGCGLGLGVRSWDGLRGQSAMPSASLREGFETIRARDGLAVLRGPAPGRNVSIQNDLFPVFRRLQTEDYFGVQEGKVTLFGPSEWPFDIVTQGVDLLAFDGSDAMEAAWFNLLNEGAPVAAIGTAGGSLAGGRIPEGQTFLKIDGAPTREKVLDAALNGRSTISFGPAVFCSIMERDKGPGAVLPPDGRPLTLQIRAFSTMTPGSQLAQIEILRNGVPLVSQAYTEEDNQSQILDMRVPIAEVNTAWYMVRVTERNRKESRFAQKRRAWTSPIYFRGPAFAVDPPAVTHVRGQLTQGLTPIRGVVTAIAPGKATQRVETGPDGRYALTLPAAGTLIFEAPECEPVARRVFEHPRVQRALGRQLAAGDWGKTLADKSVYNIWRYTLSDLEWDVALSPLALPEEKSRLPEPK
jgi:hypothetical protein